LLPQRQVLGPVVDFLKDRQRLLLCQMLVRARWSLSTPREFMPIALRLTAVMVDHMGSWEGLRRWASTAWATPPLHLEYLTFVHRAITKPSDRLMMTIVSSAHSSGWPQPLRSGLQK